jgi:hypothetical protein
MPQGIGESLNGDVDVSSLLPHSLTYELTHELTHQVEGRKPALWGHMLLHGALEPIQYFSADFSGNMPCGNRRIVFAYPPSGCVELTNKDEDLQDR